ncbi:MAG: ABC transporter permease [Planctomycetes bacterium RIFCSPLOWO2_12_38_17]|nr:MAG: ABC transporter permease [Planctomycetes bacterium RIFCSPLOWO2_12_38_17]
MNFIALKMLIGDRAKYLGIIFGLAFASLLITQQMAIFLGLMTRTYGFLTDTPQPDIWVVDPKVQYIDDLKPLRETDVLRVRGVEGVAWAVRLYKGLLKARLPNGTFQNCIVVGLDDETLIGGPPVILEGELSNLRHNDAIIVDNVGADGKLANVTPDGRRIPLRIGDTMELNDHRAIVAGICRVTRTFQSQPVVYTTYSRATVFAPRERKLMSFVLVKANPGYDLSELCQRIRKTTGLAAYTKDEIKTITVRYYMKYTGIPVNFGITVILGFIVGVAIAGQTFYNFTQDNIRYFGTLKAMGASDFMLLKMVLLQAAMVGGIGYGMGVGAASTFSFLSGRTELSFCMPWQLLVASAVAIALICIISSFLSMWRIVKLEPAIVFKT